MEAADVIYGLGESLWYACACTGYPSKFADEMAALMRDLHPGDPCIVTMTLRRPSEDLVGTLISVEDEPYPDWDEEANGEPAPRRPVWTILTIDGRRLRWENVQVLRLPRSQHEAEYRLKHLGPGGHGRCQVCAWDAERKAFLAAVMEKL